MFKFFFEEFKLVLIIVQEWYLIWNDLRYVGMEWSVLPQIVRGTYLGSITHYSNHSIVI
jgi:hypothetical protein